MSGWQNVLLSKCLGVKMLGVKMSRCQKVGCPNVGESSWRLPGDDVQQEALQLLVGHVAVEEVGQGAEGITHEVKHGDVPEGLPGLLAATEEELPEEREGGPMHQSIAEQEDTSCMRQGAHSLCGRLCP